MTENTSAPSQKGRIFISYRRIDSAGYAGRIYDRLVAYFGEDAIFMDVDTIEGGTDFIKVLEDAVQSCDVLIALIGKRWLNIRDKGGKRRLENPEDFVRIEIATALKRNIRVIPVLVDGAAMPQPTELPENIKALARRNALQVNHHSFNPDVYRLIEHSESALVEAEELRVMKAQALQVADEKAAREKAEWEAAENLAREKDAREKVEKDAKEKVRLETEEQVRKKAAKEEAERDTAEKAKRERTERLATQIVAVKSTLRKAIPFLRIAGITGISIVLLWAGSWGLSKLASLVPTAKASFTSTLRPTASFTSKPPTDTPVPRQVSSPASATPTRTATLPVSGSMKSSTVDGATLVHVPGSEGVESFWIDQAAVTNLMFEKFVNATNYATDAEKDGVGYVWTNLGERPATQFPGQTGVVLEWKLISGVDWKNPARDESRGDGDEVLQVSWNDALAYCQWAGRELVSVEEWELALTTGSSVVFYNTRNGLGEWGANKTTSVYRIVLGYQDIQWGYNSIFQDWGFAENRSANILTFRCKMQ